MNIDLTEQLYAVMVLRFEKIIESFNPTTGLNIYAPEAGFKPAP